MASPPTKAYVVPVAGREAEIDALKALVAAGGCAVVCENDDIDDFDHCIEESDVVVILICPETIVSKLIEQIIELANKSGKRIIGIWGAGAEPSKLPAALHRYGDANVPFDGDEIADVVCSGGTRWVTPEGTPRPTPKTPRHKKR